MFEMCVAKKYFCKSVLYFVDNKSKNVNNANCFYKNNFLSQEGKAMQT